MSTYTNFEKTTQNEDGSITTEIVYTERPPTKKDQVIGWTIFGGVVLVSMAPLIVTGIEELKWRREERRNRKEAAQFVKEMNTKI
jgi:hypothetical protein